MRGTLWLGKKVRVIKDTASRPSGRDNFKYGKELVLNSSNLVVPVQGRGAADTYNRIEHARRLLGQVPVKDKGQVTRSRWVLSDGN